MDRFLSTTEAAEMLGVPLWKLREWYNNGFGPQWIMRGAEYTPEIVYKESDLLRFKAVFERGIEIMPLDPDPEEVLG